MGFIFSLRLYSSFITSGHGLFEKIHIFPGVTGALVRTMMGPRGMVAGAVVGSGIG